MDGSAYLFGGKEKKEREKRGMNERVSVQ